MRMPSLRGLLSTVGCLAACVARDREPPRVTYNPDDPQEMVVVFDSGITHADVNRFNLEQLHKYEPGRGYDSRFPIQMVVLARGADGRPLLVLRLQPDATPGQRQSLDSLLKASSIVDRVLRDTAPAAVGRAKE
jgi:hypothetical protein